VCSSDLFNLFNAINPNSFTTTRTVTSAGATTVNPRFMVPLAYAGDAGNLDQRQGQVGLRFSF